MVFTSYIVAAMGGGTIVLINLISPGVTQRADVTTPLGHRSRSSWPRSCTAIAFVLIRKIDQGGRHDARRLRRPGARCASRSALLAVPMLRDHGPVERLGGRTAVREARARRSLVARCSRASPPGSGRGSRRACARSGASRSSRRLDSRAVRAAMTVQRFVGNKAALAVLLGGVLGGLLALLGSLAAAASSCAA